MRFFLFLTAGLLSASEGVDRTKFRTCKDTGFCRRHRDSTPPKFSVLPDSITHHGEDGLTALLQSEELGAPPLMMAVKFYTDGVARLQIREANPAVARWEPPDVVLDDALTLVTATTAGVSDGALIYEYVNGLALRLTLSPFSLTLLSDGIEIMRVNSRNLFHFEYHRSREGKPAMAESSEGHNDDRHNGKKIVGYWEDGLAIYEDGSREEKRTEVESSTAEGDEDGGWEESFGGHRDSKPLGPASVGMDVTFPGSQHLYGLPEHASSMQLKTTKGVGAHYSEPYRLWTLDVFEYELDEPMALYGGIPIVLSHTAKSSAAAFWFNPTETFVDIEQDQVGAHSHWISESGIADLMLIPGPKPFDVLQKFTRLVGTQELPPIFALGYHQCRWNYKDERDVAQVHAKFEELNFPYDVLWLDIEHTDGKRYFTWDKHMFPDPIAMQESLAKHGRRMVTIVDPHLKRDNGYYIHKEATEKALYVKDKDGNDYDGYCWPGSSSYLDFTQPHVRQWWAEQFSLDRYQGSTLNLFTWNDMNEPSVFNGPEVSMPKDATNLQGVEHREWHNLYGMYQQRATAEGQILRSGGKNRPFVLSRAFYAGSQRWGAIWTGDNAAEWSHLAIAAPMLLSIGLGGLTFSGADVGGFFGNTESELMVRWMQAGSYTPFFRGHAHHDTKRREPWMFDDTTTTQIRNVVMARYALLPYWYTLFYHASVFGTPTMRPLWFEYPGDESTFSMDDQWLVGADIVVKPVTSKGATRTEIYLPGDSAWYDVDTQTATSPGKVSVSTPLDKIAAFQRGGSIIPRKMRLRRSSKLMIQDPYTLFIAVDKAGVAQGDLYIDDEETFDYTEGKFALRRFRFEAGVLTGLAAPGSPVGFTAVNQIERVVVMGMAKPPRSITLSSASGLVQELTFDFDSKVKILTIRKPEILATTDFRLTMT